MSNLPNVAQLQFPASDLQTASSTQQRVYATYDWDFDTGDFKLKDGKLVQVTGLDYIKIWVQKTLRTVNNTLIYAGTDYGSDHYSLIGKDFNPDYMKSEFIRMIQDALTPNSAITAVESFSFSQTGPRLTINFDVQSIYGQTNQQVVI